MSYLPHIAARLFNTPLLIEPTYGEVIVTALADRLGVEPLVSSDVVARYERPANRMVMDKRNGIAVLPIVGSMVHRSDGPQALSGVQSYTSIQNTLMTLIDDRSVRGILLDLDTPGGESAGLVELSDFIKNASSEKPIWSIANTTAASAGMWLAASTERLYVAPGGRVGSIGVYVMHQDVSKAMEKRGVVTSFIYAGKHKVAGNPFEPLPAETRQAMQAGVDAVYQEFVSYVADARGLTYEKVRDTEAAVFGPRQAYDLGLVDGIGTLGDVLGAMGLSLNRPYSAGLSLNEEHMSTERLLYAESDIEKARAEGHATGLKAADAKIEAAVAVAKKEAASEFVTAISAAFPGNKRAAMFCEALSEGASVALATKLSLKIEDEPVVAAAAQSATAADVDRIMSAVAPNVAAGASDHIDPRAERLASIHALRGGKR